MRKYIPIKAAISNILQESITN